MTEAEQLPHQVSNLSRRLGKDLQELHDRRVGGQELLGEAFPERLYRVDHRVGGISHLVGEPRRERPQGGQLLALAEAKRHAPHRQQGPDPREQLGRRERFRDVVDGAGGKALESIGNVDKRSQEEHRSEAVSRQVPESGGSAHSRPSRASRRR